jgi:23S rRNA pseudouridine1911/1915/1917 synthase
MKPGVTPEVLFEDNHCIAVVKPAGIPVQGDKSGDKSLLELVQQDLKTRHNKPGEAFIGLVHRLDRPVGGVVIFGKTSKGASRLSEQFRTHRVTKTYWAVVEGAPKQREGSVTQWILKDRRTNVAEAFDHEVPGSKLAELTYRVLAEHGGRSLVEVTPKTGRSHQIRLAMRSLGCPIVGDVKYGAAKPLEDGSSIALHAVALAFFTPVGDELMTIQSRPVWDFIPTLPL